MKIMKIPKSVSAFRVLGKAQDIYQNLPQGLKWISQTFRLFEQLLPP